MGSVDVCHCQTLGGLLINVLTVPELRVGYMRCSHVGVQIAVQIWCSFTDACLGVSVWFVYMHSVTFMSVCIDPEILFCTSCVTSSREVQVM